MASTIIIKNKNTGAPSTLAAGELAINTEIGSLYYGSTGGTAVSSSFTFSNITSSGTISASGMIQTAGAISSSTGITASNAFFSSDVTASNLSLASTIHHTGDTNNKISFGTDTQDHQTGGSSRLDISDSGVRLGGANSRVTTILDEDNMASDSATSLATQQSIKAYVDANAGGSVSGNTFATDLKIGRDADNLIDFTTDNNIVIRANGENQLTLVDGALTPTTNAIVDLGTDALEFNNGYFDGTLEADAITIGGTNIDSKYVPINGSETTIVTTFEAANGTVGTATNATHVTVTDNENTNEENLIPFIENASATGNVGLESDGDFAYNPSTGTVSATIFKGNIDAVDGDFDGTLEADAITLGGSTVLASIDEDDMASNSATKVPTQQSVKAYVDKRVITLFSHAFGISRNTAFGSGVAGTNVFVQGNTTWGVSDRAWIGTYGTGTGNILSSFDPTHIQNGITVPFDITNIRVDVQLQSNKGNAGNTESGSFFLFKHPYTGSAVANTTVNLIPIAMNSTLYTSATGEVSYPVFSVSSSALLSGGNDNAVSASRGDLLVPMYRENVDATGGHARGNFIITAEKV